MLAPERSLDADRGQHARSISPGSDTDSIGLLVGRRGDRVAGYHHIRVCDVAGQEVLANPAQVAGRLFVEGNAGPDAGMTEQIVAESKADGKAADELEVLARDRVLPHRRSVGRVEHGRP